MLDEPRRSKRWARYGTWICLLAVLGIQLAVALPMMNAPTNVMDEGMVLVYPELLSKGVLPQRDYESFYPPGNVWFLAGVYKLLGTDIYSERTVGIFYQLLLISGIFFLFRRRSLGTAAAGCVISTLVMTRLGDTAFAWIAGLALGVWALWMLTSAAEPRTRSILAGVLAALCVTWRADLAPAMLLSFGGYCILGKWKIRDCLWLMLGGGIALIPLLVHVLIVSPSKFLDCVFYTPVFRTRDARILPLTYSNAFAGELYTMIVVSVAAALGIAWLVRKRAEGDPAGFAAVALFALGTLPQALQRTDTPHLSYVGAFAIPLVALTGSFITESPIAPMLILVGTILALPEAVGHVRLVYTGSYDSFWVMRGDRMIGTSFKTEQTAVDFLAQNAKPGQSLFVGTSDMRYTYCDDVDLYHLFPELRPATYFMEFNPLSANRPGSRLAGDIAKADWVVIDQVFGRSHEPNKSDTPSSSAPNDVVQKQFTLVCAAPPFLVYRRNANAL